LWKSSFFCLLQVIPTLASEIGMKNKKKKQASRYYGQPDQHAMLIEARFPGDSAKLPDLGFGFQGGLASSGDGRFGAMQEFSLEVLSQQCHS